MQDWSSGVAATPDDGEAVRRDPDEAVARALAWAFLAAPAWTAPALEGAARQALGRRHRWPPRVVAPVLDAYRSPPTDRSYALARFVRDRTPLVDHTDHAARRGTPVRVVEIPTVPGAMGVRRWPVPEVADLPCARSSPRSPSPA